MKWVTGIIFMSMALHAGMVDLVFIGFEEGGAPSFEQRVEKGIYEHLARNDALHLVGIEEARQYRAKIRFDDYPVVNRRLIEQMIQFCADTTLFIWGRIHRYDVRRKGGGFLKTAVAGTAELRLTVYSLSYRDYAFSGAVVCTARLPAHWRWRTGIPISARERGDIAERLAAAVIDSTGAIISTIIGKGVMGSDALAMEEDEAVEQYKIPSISDVFDVPSVEAPEIGPGAVEGGNEPSGSEEPPPLVPEDETENAPREAPPLPSAQE